MAYNKAFNPDALPAYVLPSSRARIHSLLTLMPVMQSQSRLRKHSANLRQIANNLVTVLINHRP